MEQRLRIDGQDDVLLESSLIPGGFLVYYADGEEEILHVNRYVLDLFECATIDEFMDLTGGTFKGFVHASDVSAAETSIWSQVNGRNGLDHIYYQICTKSGRLLSVDDYGRLVQRQGKRPLFYVFVAEVDQGYGLDWLTGLSGFERFKYLAGLTLAQDATPKSQLAIVTFDLMGMKLYNTRYGREGGDGLLRIFGSILRGQFGSEACCRNSGDSFVVLCEADVVEDRIDTIFRELSAADLPHTPPVVAGACLANPGDSISHLIDCAKFACDADKTTWKSHLTWFTDEMLRDATLRIHVLDNMDRALAEGWVRPYYQGIVRAATGAVCAAEALARWADPKRGLLPPSSFIDCLEEAGMLRKLDMHMVSCVLTDIAACLRKGIPLVPVSVNLSLRDLHNFDMAFEIARMADQMAVPHDLLRIEFTESTVSRDPQLMQAQIDAFHAYGFEVWLDDFGSGYSSLNVLKDFQFDLIKLDMGFCKGEQHSKSGIIVDGVIRSAKRLGLRALAEGVEGAPLANRLAELGCDMLQGFYYAEPVPLEQILKRLKDSDGSLLEPRDEEAYWNAVGGINLSDLAANNEGKGVSESHDREFPVGIFECREGTWFLLRANEALRSNFVTREVLATSTAMVHTRHIRVTMSQMFETAIERCNATGSWERIASSARYGLGFQLYVKPVASCMRARSYVVASAPTQLGAALGRYGDVPVAYAVLRVILSDEGDRAVDAEYVYTNDWYRDWGGLDTADYTGKRLLEVAPESGVPWLPLCYKAVVQGESVHDVMFSPSAGHWITFNLAPSPAEGHCVFSFMLADAEQRERQHIIEDLDTSKVIIHIIDTMNEERDYDIAMRRLLESLGELIHPDRLYIFERSQYTTSNTFEWCAPGVVSQMSKLQDIDNEEFSTWNAMIEHETSVVISDVEAYKDVDRRMFEQLKLQGVKRMLAVPLYANDKLVGYLGADNYAFGAGLNTRRLLEKVASFVGSRIASRKVVDELASASMYDALTGLRNRRGIDSEMGARIQQHPREPFVLILLDVDDFKIINDLYGHDVGDEALRTLARILTDAFPKTALIGRNGGDEALVALFGSDAHRVEELLGHLTNQKLSCALHGNRYPFSLSMGYAWHHPDADLKTTFSRADTALYSVKLGGKAGYRAWTDELEDTPQRTLLGFTSRELAEGMPLAMVAHRLNGEVLFANDGFARLLGYERVHELFKETGYNLRDFIHPNDWDRVSKSIHVEARPHKRDREYDLSFRVITRNGEVCDVLYRARLVSTTNRGDILYAYMLEVRLLDDSDPDADVDGTNP